MAENGTETDEEIILAYQNGDQEAFKKLLLTHDISYAVTWGRDKPIEVLEAWKLVKRSKK